MSESDNEKIEKVHEFVKNHEGNTLIGQVSEIKEEIETLKTEISDITGYDEKEEGKFGNIIDFLRNDKMLLNYAKLKLKDYSSLSFVDKLNLLKHEILLGFRCNYFSEFKTFLENLKNGDDVSWDAEKHVEITPGSQCEYRGNQDEFNSAGMGTQQISFEKWKKEKKIPKENVMYTWNYIKNGGKFYSPTLGNITWGSDTYKHVCSTGSYNVLRNLGLPRVSNSLNVDLDGSILTKMGLKYIGTVDPDNPEKNGYKPQDGDTAVWPTFIRDSGKATQHQATYINGHWVSDTIQNQMSCYRDKNEPKNVKIYRYNGNTAIA